MKSLSWNYIEDYSTDPLVMRIELWLFFIASIVIANIYYDGKLFQKALIYKKYIQMGGVIVFFLVLYYLFKKTPHHAKKMIYDCNSYLKYAPVDNKTKSFLEPMLQMSNLYNDDERNSQTNNAFSAAYMADTGANTNINMNTKYKRNVSETKKKLVSSNQGWKCGSCKNALTAFYEVDHILPLYKGGTNDVSNLVSLCRECHAKKTAMDRMKDEI